MNATSASATLTAPPVVSAERSGFAALALLAFAHFFIDLYSGALSGFQPLLVAKHGLSLSQAGMLGGALVFSSSLLQPLYGILSDRYPSWMFTVLAPAVAGVFISLLGWAPSYPWLFALVVLGGAGVASFHPQATANATAGIPTNPGRWMAVFISSGTLGMAIGPACYSLLVGQFGLENSWLGAIPGLIFTVILWQALRNPPVSSGKGRISLAPLRAVWRPLTVHYLLVFIRSVVHMCFAHFLPLYLSRERGFSLPSAALGLTLYMTFGALGGFVGGHLADRFGGRRVILISMVGCLPFLAVFFLTEGWLSLLGLALGGLMLLFTIPVNLLMGQRLVPGQAGTVSALLMGFAWGSAGLIFIPLTGVVADYYGLHTALACVSALPLAGWFLARTLPEKE
jgi:FSR family fosmidomycin resistance protein-like MFS transporter